MMDEEKCCSHSRVKMFIAPMLGIVLIILAVFLVGLTRNAWKAYGYIGLSPEFKDRITVNGVGKVTIKPDVGVINIGIVTEKTTVTEAQKENTNKMNAIVDSLKKEFKVAEKDIVTSQYNVSPKYDWTDGKQRIVGYTVNQSVTIKARDFDKIGGILAKAGTLGANSVNGPSFTIDDPEVYRQQAREKAITQAKEKAKVLADQVGIKLGRIVNFSEGGDAMPVYYNDAVGMGGEMSAKVVAVAPQIESGSQDVTVNVSISYEVK